MTKRGFTLVEVIVVITLLGLLYGIAAVAVPAVNVRATASSREQDEARIEALRTGQATMLRLPGEGRDTTLLLLPDGRALTADGSRW